jgi:hypothetical protein
MTAQIITSFSATGAVQYGRRAVRSLRRFSRTPLVVYLDSPTELVDTEVRWTRLIPGWPETYRRLPMTRPDATRPDHYKWHARRFAVKPFVWADAAEELQTGVLTWLDGDTEAIARVPDSLWGDLLGEADVAFLGRQRMHPETGYVGFRLPAALPLIRWCREAYRSGDVLTWADGWTDCHVLRRALAAVPVTARDLTSHRYQGKSHIWPLSPLAPYLRHYKGRQKRRPQPC